MPELSTLNQIMLGLNIGSILLLLIATIFILKFKRFEKSNTQKVLTILSITIFLFIIINLMNSYNLFSAFLNIPISSNAINLITKLVLIPLTAIFTLVAISALRG